MGISSAWKIIGIISLVANIMFIFLVGWGIMGMQQETKMIQTTEALSYKCIYDACLGYDLYDIDIYSGTCFCMNEGDEKNIHKVVYDDLKLGK